LAVALSFLDMLLSLRRDKRLWYEILSKTRNASYFKREKNGGNGVQHIDH
jgi:hypothetical protein